MLKDITISGDVVILEKEIACSGVQRFQKLFQPLQRLTPFEICFLSQKLAKTIKYYKLKI